MLSATLLAAGFGAGAVAAGLTTASADPPSNSPAAHALFVQTDALGGNQVLAYQRGTDGSLALSGTYGTGGNGGLASGASADPLASQGSLLLTPDGQDLVAVNAGSDTVSVFGVRGTQLTLDDVVPSGGSFPVSLAIRGNLVEVLNAGGTGTVAGFNLRHDQLVAVPNGARSLGLANTDPPNFLAGAGEVGFTPAGNQLVVTTKGSTNAYEVFGVAGDALSATAVVTSSATPVPFAFTFDAAGHLVATEAGLSTISTYTVNADGTLSLIGSAADGKTALCWVSLANGVAYGSNAGSGNVSSFSIASNGTPTLANAVAATTHAGTTDSVVDPTGSTLYVESGGAGALDVFHIGAAGALSPVETVWNLPVGAEGLAVS
jgi:6-phosphogluconolactonase (cycloisomerase 2 family)